MPLGSEYVKIMSTSWLLLLTCAKHGDQHVSIITHCHLNSTTLLQICLPSAAQTLAHFLTIKPEIPGRKLCMLAEHFILLSLTFLGHSPEILPVIHS